MIAPERSRDPTDPDPFTDESAGSEPLRRRAAELDLLYKNAPVGLCLVDRDLRFVRINERLAAIHGAPVSAHIGRTVREMLPSIADQIEDHYRGLLRSGLPILGVERRATLPSDPDSEHVFIVSDHPVVSASGRVEGIVTVVQDVTERRNATRDLHVVKRRLCAAQRMAGLGCFEWNLATDEFWITAELAELLGVRRIPGRRTDFDTIVEAVREDDRAVLRRQIKAALESGEASEAVVRTSAMHGNERVMRCIARLERDEGDRPARIVGTFQDVTAQQREIRLLEQEIARLRREVEERGHEIDRVRARRRTRPSSGPESTGEREGEGD